MKAEDDVPEKGQIEREYAERLHEQELAEKEALKLSRIVKGADTKNYKKFKDGEYVRPPKAEMSDEMKLKVMRSCQFLTGFIGFVGLGMTFFVIYDSTLHLSMFENFVIILRLYNLMLYLSIFESYLVIEINLILLGCALVAASVMGIINLQHKHDKISDRINARQSTRTGIKKATRRYYGLIIFMGVGGIGIIFLDTYHLTNYISIFENFVIGLSIYNSTLHLSIFDDLIIKINLILLGFALATTSLGIIGFRYKRSNRINAGQHI
jgi:hypothetical protein